MIAFDVPSTFVQLVFVREAWGLEVRPEIPPADPVPLVGTSTRPDDGALESLWRGVWTEAATAPRRPVLGAPRLWTDVYGTTGLDMGALTAWSDRARGAVTTVLAADRGDAGRRVRRRTESAEAAGLLRVDVLPLDGPYREQLVPYHLVLGLATYLDDALWDAALPPA
ncbi:MAG TPA: hypothetical protein VGC57_08315 [Cellulomonas sp.]